MSNKKSNEENNALASELQVTEVGSWLLKNKIMVISLVVAVLIAVIGQVVFNQLQSKWQIADANQVYQFKTEALKKYLDKKDVSKEDHTELIGQTKALIDALKTEETKVSVSLQIASTLASKKQFSLAAELISPYYEKVKSNSYLYYLVGSSLSVYYEEMKDYEQAIKVTSALLSAKDVFLESKIHFDLARLHLQKGDLAKAREKFSYVVAKFQNGSLEPEDSDAAIGTPEKDKEIIKLAHMYLGKLGNE